MLTKSDIDNLEKEFFYHSASIEKVANTIIQVGNDVRQSNRKMMEQMEKLIERLNYACANGKTDAEIERAANTFSSIIDPQIERVFSIMEDALNKSEERKRKMLRDVAEASRKVYESVLENPAQTLALAADVAAFDSSSLADWVVKDTSMPKLTAPGFSDLTSAANSSIAGATWAKPAVEPLAATQEGGFGMSKPAAKDVFTDFFSDVSAKPFFPRPTETAKPAQQFRAMSGTSTAFGAAASWAQTAIPKTTTVDPLTQFFNSRPQPPTATTTPSLATTTTATSDLVARASAVGIATAKPTSPLPSFSFVPPSFSAPSPTTQQSATEPSKTLPTFSFSFKPPTTAVSSKQENQPQSQCSAQAITTDQGSDSRATGGRSNNENANDDEDVVDEDEEYDDEESSDDYDDYENINSDEYDEEDQLLLEESCRLVTQDAYVSPMKAAQTLTTEVRCTLRVFESSGVIHVTFTDPKAPQDPLFAHYIYRSSKLGQLQGTRVEYVALHSMSATSKRLMLNFDDDASLKRYIDHFNDGVKVAQELNFDE